MVATSTGSAAPAGTEAVMPQRPVAMAAQERLRHRRFQMLPPVIRIVSGIHACPNRRIAPAPRDPGPVQVAQPRAASSPTRCAYPAVRAARESVDFTPKGSQTVRVQTVNAESIGYARCREHFGTASRRELRPAGELEALVERRVAARRRRHQE